MHLFFDTMRHLPDALQVWALNYGPGILLILALIVFCETGLVVAPFLPGDSLLFATGALTSLQIPGVSLWTMIPTLIVAAFLGDNLNYRVGRWAGQNLFRDAKSRWLNPKHLERTKDFYERNGKKTVVLARFIPVVRTYAPFVSGLSAMPYREFCAYSVGGAALWITSFLSLGYFFGNLPAIRANFHYAIFAIIGISFIPVVVECLRPKVARVSKT